MLVPQLPNGRWSLDFVADQFIDGRRMRTLIVVDHCSTDGFASRTAVITAQQGNADRQTPNRHSLHPKPHRTAHAS